VRRALVETLLHPERSELVVALDEALLGLRPRPQVTTAARRRGRMTSSSDRLQRRRCIGFRVAFIFGILLAIINRTIGDCFRSLSQAWRFS
jgi:hypothetical protein